MATVYFFTDADFLPAQAESGAYGSVNSTEFRLSSSFAGIDGGGSTLHAYAVCRGSVLIQEVDDHEGLVNLVLKPEAQPNRYYTPVKYFVYRGLKKEHFLDTVGDVIDESSSLTDLMTRMWEIRNRLNEDKANVDSSFVPEGITRGDLGLHELADAALDGETLLDELFDTFVFHPVSTGAYLGDFDTTENYGFQIMLDHKAYRNTLEDVRSLVHTLTITYDAGQQQYPDAEDITTRHTRERVLAYMDPAAWYGLLAQDPIKVGAEVTVTGDDFYDAVLTKFHTVGKVYVDIRSDLNDSLNYLEEYGTGTTNIKVGDDTSTLSTVEYHDGNGWPILALDTSLFPPASEEKSKLLFCFPMGDSEYPMLYLANAHRYDDFPEQRERFHILEYNDSPDWTDPVDLCFASSASHGVIYPAQAQISLGKRIDRGSFTPATWPSTRVLRNDFLDTCLQPASVTLFAKSGYVVWRALPEPYYLGWTSLTGADFMYRTGAAVDTFGEIAYAYRTGAPEIDGSGGHGQAMTELNLAAGTVKSTSFLHALRDHLRLLEIRHREITVSPTATIACVQLDSYHDYLSVDPFNQSADDLLFFAYTHDERAAIAAATGTFWENSPQHFVALTKATQTDTEGYEYIELVLGVQGIVLDESTLEARVDLVDTSLKLFSYDGLKFFTEAYAEALVTA